MASLEVSNQLRPGDKLGCYQLLVPVGVGGMGRVWAARRVATMPAKQLVAIKTGLGEVGGSPDFERLFMDEARIASMIEHPNVCGIYELGEERGVLFLAMEWSDGATLREVLDASPERRVEFGLAARIVAHVCAGLHAAHELEDVDGTSLHVVHRDVSPQNILIAAAGHVKVADFGVAKARGQLHRPTETGEMKGKLSYMAPEQVTSRDFDRRADIFALGCVLYEATLGRRPYQGGDALSTLYQLLERDIDRPTQLDPSYPLALEEILVRALAKNPDERFQTAGEMEHALESWLASSGTIVTESRIAELMHATCGDIIDKKRRLVRDTIHKLDANQSVDPVDVPLSAPSTNDPTVSPAVGAPGGGAPGAAGNGEPSSSASGGSAFFPVAARRRNSGARRLLAWVAGGAAAGIGLVFAASSLLGPANHAAKSDASRLASAVSPSIPPPQDTPVASSSRPPTENVITVTVRTNPSNAELRMDDGEPALNPLVVRQLRDSRTHVFSARAPGYRPLSQAVVFDRDREVLLELSTAKGADLSGKVPAVSVPAASSSVTPSALGPGARLPGEPPGSRRQGTEPRKLDADNPFAASSPSAIR